MAIIMKFCMAWHEDACPQRSKLWGFLVAVL